MASLSQEEKEALLTCELWESYKMTKWHKILILLAFYSIIEYLTLKA